MVGLLLILMSIQGSFAQNTTEEGEIIQLSKEKWIWMADKNTQQLQKLFHDKSVFVHMGGTWGKEQEINIIIKQKDALEIKNHELKEQKKVLAKLNYEQKCFK